MKYTAGIEFAKQADEADPLRSFRGEFSQPEDVHGLDCAYLCGHSLGLMPFSALESVRQELDEWARLGVRGHFQGSRPWLPFHRNAREGLAYLCGANEIEVAAMNSLTINLHLMMQTFYRPAGGRTKILIESTAFPSDRFAVQSQISMHGLDPQQHLLEWQPRQGETDLRLDDLQSLLRNEGDNIALMLLPGVQYYNGQMLDMPALCDLARRHGCSIGLDLAHAIGNVPLKLHEWSPDFAAWCSYKYLNSGPGAVGGVFVPERHHGTDGRKQLLGWWGHQEATRLRMSSTFVAESGVDSWHVSNPSVLAIAPLLASLDIFQRAGMAALRQKSEALSGYLRWLLQSEFGDRVTSITPKDAGAQVSIVVTDLSVVPRSIPDSLEELNVIVDWREPNVIRAAPAPLYNSFEDVWSFSQRLRQSLAR